ncbi:MAG: DUF6868 family protein [Pseudomonadota bacterium]
MTPSEIQAVLGWSIIINFGFLTLWLLIFSATRDGVYRLHTRWFNLAPHRFDEIHYRLLAQYKLAVVVFFVVPYAALCIV